MTDQTDRIFRNATDISEVKIREARYHQSRATKAVAISFSRWLRGLAIELVRGSSARPARLSGNREAGSSS